MKIQQIRSATLKIHYSDQTILLDPWLQDQGTGFSASTVRQEMNGVRSPMNALPMTPDEILAGVDFCLVTHIHPDHFTSDYLPEEMKIIVQNEDDRQEAKSMGFEDVSAFERDTMDIGSVTITKVPAIHGDNEELVTRMGIGSGYILNGENKTLYIAGDTVYCNTIEEASDTPQTAARGFLIPFDNQENFGRFRHSLSGRMHPGGGQGRDREQQEYQNDSKAPGKVSCEPGH